MCISVQSFATSQGGHWRSLTDLLIFRATAPQYQWTRFNPAYTLLGRAPPNRWCSATGFQGGHAKYSILESVQEPELSELEPRK